ncbi:MAG: hypothetical protein H7330_11085 [Hymenobacteraceae bacterium]|nr:hypothetical protein [Hymenobacteraceae bacterium]
MLIACDPAPDVLFTNPLPVGSPDLPQFPRRHRGVYALPTDSLRQVVVLPRSLVLRAWANLGRESRFVIDSFQRTQNDAGQHPVVRLIDARADSAILLVWVTDTLFKLTTPDSTRLRRKGGFYYLNRAQPTGHWQTKRLQINPQQLQLTTFTNDSLRLVALKEAGLLADLPDKPRWYLAHPTLRNQRRLLHAPHLWQPTHDSVYVRYHPKS